MRLFCWRCSVGVDGLTQLLDFLREGLESVTTDEISFKLINPLRPGLITADGDAFWYLIIPIRLTG